MDAVHGAGYPAIARAQQLSAERLGVRDSKSEHERAANRWDIPRPAQEQHVSGNVADARTERAGGGRRPLLRQITVENVAAATRSSLSPPAVTGRRGGGRGVGDYVRRDKSTSPLPPRHGRTTAQQQQRTVLGDISQVRLCEKECNSDAPLVRRV